MGVTKLEMETIVTLNREEDFAEISTSDPLLVARMVRAGIEPVLVDGTETWYCVPRGSVRVKILGVPMVRLGAGSARAAEGSKIVTGTRSTGTGSSMSGNSRVDG